MKKLFTLLFASALVFSLAMPVFARSGGSQDTATTKTKKTKKTKTKKSTSDSKMSQ